MPSGARAKLSSVDCVCGGDRRGEEFGLVGGVIAGTVNCRGEGVDGLV